MATNDEPTTAAPGSAFQNYRFRSSWARAAYHQMQFENQHRADEEHKEWYSLSNERQLSPELAGSFVQLQQDAATSEFLRACYDKADQLLTQLYHRVAKAFLSFFVSVTTANGLLRRGSMFVLSEGQFRRLLAGDDADDAVVLGDSLLDLGAGDGNVTRRYAPLYRRVFATEMATAMTWRLAERGYTLLDANDWPASGPYDLIGCVNLLDRCEAPLELLAEIRRSLRPGSGRLLLAVVLPFSQFCEFTPDRRPRQRLLVHGDTFERQVNSLVNDVLEPQGWRVERWTKAPYLCEGDLYQSFYHLADAVLLLRPN